eukprot:15473701-Alexandrium_andersonii.AAC.1
MQHMGTRASARCVCTLPPAQRHLRPCSGPASGATPGFPPGHGVPVAQRHLRPWVGPASGATLVT